ncbi:MAG: hypothetical protein WBM78_18640, partial [Desulfobacterales bacterium]
SSGSRLTRWVARLLAERSTLNRGATSLLFDANITARSGDDRRQIDTGRLHPHSALIKLTGVFRGCLDEFTTL